PIFKFGKSLSLQRRPRCPPKGGNKSIDKCLFRATEFRFHEPRPFPILAPKFSRRIRMNNLDRGTATRHQELAVGQRQLPNLAVRSAFSIILLYGLLTLALITTVELGYLTENVALAIGVVFGVLQFTIGPWLMDWSLGWFYSMSWMQPQQLPEHLQQFVDRV